MPVRDANKIDVSEALRIYRVWRNWREVAKRLVRPNGMPFRTASVWLAVRRSDLQAAE